VRDSIILSERAVKFISRALEASSSFDLYLLLLKLAFRRFGVVRGASSRCACKDYLQKSSSIVVQLLIQPGSTVLSLILNFI
jgi:hypothetical protein